MVNVGCSFEPDDLPPDAWDGLINLAQERARMDRLIFKQKTAADKEERKIQDEITKARQASGIPAPGRSLFPKAPTRGRRR